MELVFLLSEGRGRGLDSSRAVYCDEGITRFFIADLPHRRTGSGFVHSVYKGGGESGESSPTSRSTRSSPLHSSLFTPKSTNSTKPKRNGLLLRLIHLLGHLHRRRGRPSQLRGRWRHQPRELRHRLSSSRTITSGEYNLPLGAPFPFLPSPSRERQHIFYHKPSFPHQLFSFFTWRVQLRFSLALPEPPS